MTSGTTEKLTAEQVKERCWQKLQEASAEFIKVNQQIERRLAKDGIPVSDFTKYCFDKEPPKN